MSPTPGQVWEKYFLKVANLEIFKMYQFKLINHAFRNYYNRRSPGIQNRITH